MSLRALVHVLPAPLIRRLQAGLFSLLRLRWTLATGIELRVLSRTDWVLYNDIFVDGEYDDSIRELIRHRDPQEAITVVDLGANVGFFSFRLFHLLALAGIPAPEVRVVSVEPSPGNRAELQTRMHAQAHWGSCVSIVPGLVGARRSGSADLFESHNYGSNTLFEGFRYPGARRVAADFVDLDRLLPGDNAIDLLKCDIEGAEQDFVQEYGSFLRRVRIAIFEVHHEVCDVEQVKAHLRAAGLSFERIIADRGNTSVRMYVRESP